MKTDAVPERLLSPEQVARERLSCSRKHVYALVHLGALTAVKIGTGARGMRITESSVAAFIERNIFRRAS